MKDLSELPENFILWEQSVARVGDDEEFLLELLNDLNEMVEESIPQLKQALDDSDFKTIKEKAHSLKGSSGNLGLNIMYENTMNLEKSADSDDKDSALKCLSSLEEDFENLKYILKD